MQRYLNNGQRLTLAKRYDAAIKQYEKILKLKTSGENMRQALIAIADLYRERQEYSQAIEIYNQLRAQDPNSVLAAWAGLQVGDSQLLANQPDASYQTYLDISQKFPKSDWAAEAQLGTGKVLEKKEKYPEAIAAYQVLVKEYPGGFLAAEALVRIGQCCEFSGDFKSARKAYQTVLDKFPSTTWDDAKARLDHLDAAKEGEGVRVWGDSK